MIERFLAFVDKAGPGGCWLWTGAVQARGYGAFGIGGTRVAGAHRVAFELWKGPIPAGAQVRHTCDRRACVNPKHLLVGTPKQNSGDMLARGREASGDKHGKAKLDAQARRTVRLLRADGKTQREIADVVGVHQSTISHFLAGHHYRRNAP